MLLFPPTVDRIIHVCGWHLLPLLSFEVEELNFVDTLGMPVAFRIALDRIIQVSGLELHGHQLVK
jgi:hypothetical protein